MTSRVYFFAPDGTPMAKHKLNGKIVVGYSEQLAHPERGYTAPKFRTSVQVADAVDGPDRIHGERTVTVKQFDGTRVGVQIVGPMQDKFWMVRPDHFKRRSDSGN